jgi:hypothetical protein
MFAFRGEAIEGAGTDMEQESYRVILRRAGFVLVAVGLIDIGRMIYCIINSISYSSSLNIFAVIAGILLIRGGLKTAGLVRWLSLFFLSAIITLVVNFPLVQPIGLTLAEIRFDTRSVLVSVLFLVVLATFLYWVARELGREPVQIAREAAGLKRRSARVPILCGIGVVVAAFVMVTLLLRGESAERATREAAKEVGPEFSFHVTSLNINQSGRHKSVSAVVAAWNDKEVRDIPVQWEEGVN